MSRKPAGIAAQAGGRRSRRDYRLPALWDCWGFPGRRKEVPGQIIVDPFEYATACLEWIYGHSDRRVDYAGKSLSQILRTHRLSEGSRHKSRPGDWIAGQTLYAMMVRTTTAWDHNGDGCIHAPIDRPARPYQELGTFLKSVLLLPLLRKMGITVLYLLPVVKVSNLHRKGELGCPYSARNFLELDQGQHDPLYGRNPSLVTEEFALFVECAHRLGMRVMLDIAPRTAARDCDWILEHPEWFYWIDRRFEKGWRAPKLPGIRYGNPIAGRLKEIYRVPGVRRHLAKFRFPPNVTQPREWQDFAARAAAHPPKDLMAAIGRRFGVVTAPGFSDVINDPQPAWSDVTYFRLYEDRAPEAAGLLPDPLRQAPYVLCDTIKSNLFPARKPHHALWDRIADIIPFYQQFGIDGARVDMAHALPRKLERMILDRPRQRDPDFSFIAEDLSHRNTAGHKRGGYNLVLGAAYHFEPRADKGLMHRLLKDLPGLSLPILGAAETPDTPRAVVRKGGVRFSRWAAVVNMFLPKAVPMINSGMEVLERQPMNLGLDVGPPGRFALPRSDPQYGKLAFFDPYALHWTNPGGPEMIDLIARAAAIRREYLRFILSESAFFAPRLANNAHRILATGFRLGPSGGRRRGKPCATLLMLANVDMDRPRRTAVQLTVPRQPRAARTSRAGNDSSHPNDAQVLLELTPSAAPALTQNRLSITLPAGDVKIIRV